MSSTIRKAGQQDRNRTLPRPARLLLSINALNALGTALSSIFISVYWYKLTQDMSQTLLFNLVTYLVWLPGFAAAGWLSKRASRTRALWIGSALQVLFYVLVLVLGTNSSEWLILLGIINGLGQGFYWLSINVLSVDVTRPENRDWFNGVNGIMGSAAGMLGPLAAGTLVEAMPQLAGYTTVFLISFMCFLLSLVSALLLPQDNLPDRFDWRGMLAALKLPDWRMLSYAFVGTAFRDGALSVAVWLWVFIATGSAGSTGRFAFFTTLLSVAGYFVVGRLGQDRHRRVFMMAGTVLISCSMFGITYLTAVSLVLYGFVSAASRPFFDAPFSTLTYNTIGRLDQSGRLRIELVVWREAALSLGRISSVAFLYGIYRWGGPKLDMRLNFFLLLLALMGLLPLLLLLQKRTEAKPRQEAPLEPSRSNSA